MDIRILRYFLTLVREQNISRAAQALFITQPTLSRQMAQLEEELGVPLFERGKRLRLTNAGILLSKRAAEVVEMMDKMKAEFSQNAIPAGIIHIGMGGLSASQQLLNLSREFQKDYPQVQFRFYIDNADDIWEKLDSGLLDFAVLLEPIEITHYDYLRFKQPERWGLLMSATSPFAAKTNITAQDLIGLPLMTTARQTLQKELEHWLKGQADKLTIVATYNLIAHLAPLIAEGNTYALAIEGAITLLDHSRLVFRPLSPALNMSAVLAWKKTHSELGAAARFLQFMREQI